MLSNEIDPKLPTWGGQWTGYADYVTRVELKADGTKDEELPLLGPRLASNLTGRAFDWLIDVDRQKLKEKEGWSYLLDFLKSKREHSKLDILGEAFSEFFLKKDACRREGEDLSEFESRFRTMTRKLEKAMKESECSSSGLPTEVYGWFLINVFIRLDPSDTANVRGRAEDYKEETVWKALHRMWSGGGLLQKDLELKKKQPATTRAYHANDADEDGEGYPTEEVDVEAEELEDAIEWYQEAQEQMLTEPDSGEVLANFKEARKALDRARTSRGYYPMRKPGWTGQRNRGQGNQFSADYSEKICMRCGKKGHIARLCKQKLPTTDSKPKGSSVNFVGTMYSAENQMDKVNDEPKTNFLACDKGDDASDHGVSFFNMDELCRGKAILDSGASDNIVGAETLQTLSDMYQELEFDPAQEIEVDRNIHKRFVFGNNQTSSGLGLGHINTGICGRELKIQAHVVEGATPFLLSSKFLYDMKAEVDFRTGQAVFHALSEDVIQLERTPNHHLLLPLTAFAGNVALLTSLFATSTSSTERSEVRQEAMVGTASVVNDTDHPKGTDH